MKKKTIILGIFRLAVIMVLWTGLANADFDCSKHYQIESNGKVWIITYPSGLTSLEWDEAGECKSVDLWRAFNYSSNFFNDTPYYWFDFKSAKKIYQQLCWKEKQRIKYEKNTTKDKIAEPYYFVDPKTGKRKE